MIPTIPLITSESLADGGPDDSGSDGGLIRQDSDVKEDVRDELKEPDMWDVVLHNDNYTTKFFVVEIVSTIFHKSAIEATKIMMQVHKRGKGIVGTYTYDVAQTKVNRVHELAKKREFPLRCSIEKANN